ncbi:DUF3748 domain-containing protein [Dyadobacter pollutisoli]|uniref:DUF3748 domain-containing protein n=1 Tax=Dyadobacter pollutisoli TaxID=2910158 RepID=A0A9E8N805_9BACT|nr:DUF3748 domain-containing protein [Dyadobacter pollutisoli]WAC11599.1 DUF3748 domain-containing protein [Dyadobacter pollutisoli]
MLSCQTDSISEEKQITNDLTYNHDLDNNDNFSPDGKWLVYDTRTDDGGIAASARIERVNIETGEKQVLFDIKNNQTWGPGAGAVSYSSKDNAVVFIHGLTNSTEANPYQQWRRTGVIIHDSRPNEPIYMDARDVTFPFTAGALRGGTHRHEWSGDGQWIGFTYNDAILKALEDSTGQKRNLRTIGVSKKIKAVHVDKNEENVSGEWFSALVVRVVPEPAPGSDEISHAAGDSWVGTNGYLAANGQKQIARAFLGTVKDKNGKDVPEVFVVDIPEDITQPGPLGPLEGSKDDFPMPPNGTVQRRLTYTANTSQPGCLGIVRSSPDGKYLAYLAKDEKGISQIFVISPTGGKPQQLTEHDYDVIGNVRWHPDGQHVTYVWKGSITLCKTGTEPFAERIKTLTKPTNPAPTNLVWSHDGGVVAFNRLLKGNDTEPATQQVFACKVEPKSLTEN